MTEKDIKRLEQIAIDKLKKGVTREEALRMFIAAGIKDKNGNYTKPYRNLGKAMKKLDV